MSASGPVLVEVGWHFDLQRLRSERPWLQAFEPWLRAQHEAGNT